MTLSAVRGDCEGLAWQHLHDRFRNFKSAGVRWNRLVPVLGGQMQLTQAVGALHRVLFPGHPCVCHLTRRRQAKDMSLVPLIRVAIAYVGHEAL